jgi:hypothetical protein
MHPSTPRDPRGQDKPLTTTTFLSFLSAVITPPLLFWGPLFWAAPPSTLVSPSFEGITLQVSGGGLLPGFGPTSPPSLRCLNWLCGC